MDNSDIKEISLTVDGETLNYSIPNKAISDVREIHGVDVVEDIIMIMYKEIAHKYKS